MLLSCILPSDLCHVHGQSAASWKYVYHHMQFCCRRAPCRSTQQLEQWLMFLYAGCVTLPSGTEMVMPGDNVSAEFELFAPVAMEPGLRFAVREGGRTVGAGVVSKVIS